MPMHIHHRALSASGIVASLAMCLVTAMAQDAPRAAQVVEPPAAEASAAPDTVISRSNQFRISGGDSLVRGSVALLAEETKDDLLRLTGAPDEWKIPISIRLHGRPGDPLPARTLSMRLLVVEDVRELRLDVHLSRGIEQERFQRSLTMALIHEHALRKAAAVPDQALVVPPWLAEGLREATAWRLNRSDRRLYEALFKRGGLYKLDDLFAADEATFENLDGAMRAAFRVSSGALVMALLEQPQGREGFRAFIDEVADFQGEMPALLRKHFPELNLSETSLAKWWALQLATMGGLNLLTDTLTIPRTETALAEALRLAFRTPEGIAQEKELAAWPELAELPEAERAAAVRPAQDGLVRLSYRCFPSYRPIIAEYQILLSRIAKNQTRDIPVQLAALEQTRQTMLQRANRARDYLDWFEITRARETSGAFDDYLRLKERLKSNPVRRDDPLSRYLDRMDRLFFREPPDRPALPPP
jgi:hypothetical protein